MSDLVIGTDGFEKLLSKLDELPQTVFKDMGYALLTAVLLVEAVAKDNVHKNFKGKGTMAASISHKVLKVRGLALAGVVGTNLPYGAVHEFGATIEPKNTDWLTIPFTGVEGRAKDYQDTFFAWSKNNNLILFQRQGKGQDPKPLFVLVKKTEVPARPWLNPALEACRDRVTHIISEALERSLKNVAGK